jgi:hypothetical protein
MFKSFDLIGVDNGVFAISVLSLAFILIVGVYLSAPVFAPICSSAKISSSTVGTCTCVFTTGACTTGAFTAG